MWQRNRSSQLQQSFVSRIQTARAIQNKQQSNNLTCASFIKEEYDVNLRLKYSPCSLGKLTWRNTCFRSNFLRNRCA